MPISLDDAESLQYFHEERGDITRWTKFEELEPMLNKDHPEVLAAVQAVTVAERTLDAVIEKLCNDAFGREYD